jgi:hypothetical protein
MRFEARWKVVYRPALRGRLAQLLVAWRDELGDGPPQASQLDLPRVWRAMMGLAGYE